jgi:hypothetical protein
MLSVPMVLVTCFCSGSQPMDICAGLISDRVLELFRRSEVWRVDLSSSFTSENGLNLAGADTLKGPPKIDVCAYADVPRQCSRSRTASSA